MYEKDLYCFVSDAHLGLRFKNYVERERIFASFLETLHGRVRVLYLVGDIFDFWYEYRHVIPRGFTRTLGALAKLADSGVEIRFFNGNHDIWTYDFLQTEIGVKIECQPKIEILNGKRFYIAHGDGLTKGDNGYKLLKAIFRCRFLQILFSGLHPRWAFGFGHAWSRHNRLTKGDLYKFHGEKEPIVEYAEQVQSLSVKAGEPIDYFIFGHYHFGVDYDLKNGGKLYIMGEWIGKFDYLIFDGERVTRHYFMKSE